MCIRDRRHLRPPYPLGHSQDSDIPSLCSRASLWHPNRRGGGMRVTGLEQLNRLKDQGLRQIYPDRLKIVVGMATCGISAGADKVWTTLEQHLAEAGLQAVL